MIEFAKSFGRIFGMLMIFKWTLTSLVLTLHVITKTANYSYDEQRIDKHGNNNAKLFNDYLYEFLLIVGCSAREMKGAGIMGYGY